MKMTKLMREKVRNYILCLRRPIKKSNIQVHMRMPKPKKKLFLSFSNITLSFLTSREKKHSFSQDQCIVTFTSVSHGFRAVSNELSFFFYKHILCGLVETNEYAGADEK